MPKAAWLLFLVTPTFLFADELGDQLLAATRKGDLAAVKQLLDNGADVNTKTRYDSTPLFFACDRGHLEIARLLIERGANLNVKDNFYSATALSWAMSKKHDAIVSLLVEKGVDPSDALRGSVQQGDQKLFQMILDKAKLPQALLDEALLVAGVAKRDEMAKALEAKGAKKIDFPVDEAALKGYAGKYGDGDMVFTFAAKDGALTFQQQQGSAVKLVAFAKDRFKFLQAGIEFVFERDAAGAVRGLSFTGRGGDVKLKKAAE